MARELPGYAAAATAYVTVWLQSAQTPPDPGLGEAVRQLSELIRRRLDDDDAIGATYLFQSPRSGRARRTFARDVELAAQEHPGFATALRAAVDGLGAARGLEFLLSSGGAAVVHSVVKGDRRNPDTFRPGLVAALGGAAPDLMLGAAGQAAAAEEAATRTGTAPRQALFRTLFSISVVSFTVMWVAGVLRAMPLCYGAGVVFLLVATPTAVWHRTRRRRA
ncbi:hypothetical protein ABNF97_14520 [Plantactinospora sp. B6F1]|uniref:hypothetical protein n=1 Tax=Plantactinospora sp. B6F1 TaxID=3158971 RepID=UPI00102B41F6